MWSDNNRRQQSATPLYDVLHKYTGDYKVIFVGDASMSPYEITMAGGSVEYMNQEAGSTWMKRLTDTFQKVVWLNPEQEQHWGYTQSISVVQELVDDKMYPMTIAGLEAAMNQLTK